VCGLSGPRHGHQRKEKSLSRGSQEVKIPEVTVRKRCVQKDVRDYRIPWWVKVGNNDRSPSTLAYASAKSRWNIQKASNLSRWKGGASHLWGTRRIKSRLARGGVGTAARRTPETQPHYREPILNGRGKPAAKDLLLEKKSMNEEGNEGG